MPTAIPPRTRAQINIHRLTDRAESRAEADAIFRNVEEEIEKAVARLGRSEYVLPSLSHSAAFPVYSDEMLVKAINDYAPEHLIISTEDHRPVIMPRARTTRCRHPAGRALHQASHSIPS